MTGFFVYFWIESNSMRTIFLVVFIFCIAELSAQESFNQETMFKNKVEKISVYSPVPKTNPEYYNEPKGFMHVSDHYFNEVGQETNSICFSCSIASHSASRDLVKKYTYQNGQLINMRVTGLDTINVSYVYFPIKSCRLEIIANDDNERISLAVVYNDILGEEISRTGIDFRGVTPTNHFVYIDRQKMLFSGKMKKVMSRNNLYSVTMPQVAILRSSGDLGAIEECISEIKKQMSPYDINSKEFVAMYLMEYDASGNLIKNLYNPDNPGRNDKVTYEYDKNGLLLKSAHYYEVFTDRREYRYSLRK
jgi:hypothetical protein